MSEKDLAVGELVRIINNQWAGSVAEIEPVDENCEDFAQPGYQLIMLGNHVIEQKFIVYQS